MTDKTEDKTLTFPGEIDFDIVLKSLRHEWDTKHTQTGVFNYKLNIKKERVLDGKYRYFIQVNIIFFCVSNLIKQL